MKTFDQCKDEIAEKYGCLDWSDLINSPIEDDKEIISKLLNEAAELYAQEVAKDASVSFGAWYSGMTNDKVERAYERYLKEVNQPNQEKP